jgi:hypothetical protein
VSHAAELALGGAGVKARRVAGPLLWTHFGISGPAALDMSRHWLREQVGGRSAALAASFVPGATFADAERWIVRLGALRPRTRIATALRDAPLEAAGHGARAKGMASSEAGQHPPRLPAALADALAVRACGARDLPLAALTREGRRACLHALTALPLEVSGSRGYTHAEATAGGVDLSDVNSATLQSRRCPGVFFAGEILDVDGRLGGFNFQWAWASARAAATGVAGYLRDTA